MFHATKSRIPASTDSGTCTRQRREQHHHGQQRQRVHDAGDGRAGAGADIGHRAGDGARGRHAAEEWRDDVGDALCHQLLVGIVAWLAAHLVGHTRAQQRLDGAEQGDRHGRRDELLDRLPAEGRQLERRQPLRNAAEARADGLHRQAEQPRSQAQRDQRDDRPGQARTQPHCARLEHTAEHLLHRLAKPRVAAAGLQQRPARTGQRRTASAEPKAYGVEGSRHARPGPGAGRTCRRASSESAGRTSPALAR